MVNNAIINEKAYKHLNEGRSDGTGDGGRYIHFETGNSLNMSQVI